MPARFINHYIPQAHDLVAMPPEDVAIVLLRCLRDNEVADEAKMNNSRDSHVHSGNFGPYRDDTLKERVSKKLMESWVWLQRECLVAPDPTRLQSTYVFVTERGVRAAEGASVEAYKRASLLPKELLHPYVVAKSFSAFYRGEYDIAVLAAFKELEIAVRSACSLPDDILGMTLMRLAFKESTGRLARANDPPGEQEAIKELFAGAIGSYKNPHSHRHVTLDAEEAVEMLIIASHLLKIVDARAAISP